MENVYMPLQLAPSSLNQPILPNWSFNLFSVEDQNLRRIGSAIFAPFVATGHHCTLTL
jgi:hypothetical protein